MPKFVSFTLLIQRQGVKRTIFTLTGHFECFRAHPSSLHSRPHNSGEQNTTLSSTAKAIRCKPPRAEDASVACVTQSI